MILKDIFRVLSAKIRLEDSFRDEPYGAYNIQEKDWDKEVKRVLFCVTATHQVLDHFFKEKYDLLIQHHPFVVPGIPLFIFHTALDCCADGHNDMWSEALGVKNAIHFDKNMGRVGEIDPISFEDLKAKCRALIEGKEILGYTYTNGEPVKSVAICSGLGGIDWRAAEASGAECYVTGQLLYPCHGNFKHIIELGHTHTEFIGVRLIRKLLEGTDVQVDGASLDIDYYGEEVCMGKDSLSYEWETVYTDDKFVTISPAGWMKRGKRKEWGFHLFECDEDGFVAKNEPITTLYAPTKTEAKMLAEERADELGYEIVEPIGQEEARV